MKQTVIRELRGMAGLSMPGTEGGETELIALLLLFILALLAWSVYQHIRFRVRERESVDRIREQIVRDLHDEMGGKLTVITLFGELARKELPKNRETAMLHLDKVLVTSRELYGSMKDLLWLFNPAEDQVEDLWSRLQVNGETLFRNSGICYRTESAFLNGLTSLSLEKKRHILLIFKEAMNNTLKHAACTEAYLQLEKKDRFLCISWRDDGVGFDAAMGMERGEGLRNMRHRAGMIGAELRLQPSPAGTMVALKCPLDPT